MISTDPQWRSGSGIHPPAETRPAQTVFCTEWFKIVAEYGPGSAQDNDQPYYTLERPDGLMVLAMTDDGRMVLVRQFRPAVGHFTLEIPCGHVAPEEDPQAAAVRELYEETGYRCDRIQRIGAGRVMLDRVRSREYLFFGEGARRDPDFRPQEPIQVVLANLEELKQWIYSGQFEQLATLGTLLLAHWRCGLAIETPPARGEIPA
jgi:ADP-ribose pyrophosphatase